MQKIYTENELLRLIKIVPLSAVLIFSVIITYIIINNNINKYNTTIKQLKINLIKEKKELIKNQTNEIVKQINYQKDIALDKLKVRLKKRINNAYNISLNIYNKNKNLEKNNIIIRIKNAIRPIRYDNNRGYFFIYDMKGTNILLPPAPKYEGKNMISLQDKKGFYMIQESIHIAKTKNEGYIKWYWYKPNDNITMYEKIGYIKYLKELDIFIGIGEYFEDFKKEIQNELLQKILLSKTYNKNYLFIEDYKGSFLSNAKDEIDNKDFHRAMKNIKSDCFIKYKINNNILKLSYVKNIDEWQWHLGTGIYVNEIDKLIQNNKNEFELRLKNTVISILISSILLTLLFLSILFIFLNKIENQFLRYKTQILKEINGNKEKDKLLFEQSKMASMGEMIGNIAHQWRQPLSVILTLSSNIQMKLMMDDINKEQIDKSCKIINDNTSYLSKTIDDFRNFIMGDREKADFYIKNTLKSLVNIIDSTLKSNKVNLILDLNDDIKINGFENELLQCFMNICNNAKDVLIESNIENKLIIIDANKINNKLIINIKDNGSGIPSNIIKKIFEPYFTTKDKSKGTGLGLYMTYELISKGMNGSIKADNVEFEYDNSIYKGAMFTIKLPINE